MTACHACTCILAYIHAYMLAYIYACIHKLNAYTHTYIHVSTIQAEDDTSHPASINVSPPASNNVDAPPHEPHQGLCPDAGLPNSSQGPSDLSTTQVSCL